MVSSPPPWITMLVDFVKAWPAFREAHPAPSRPPSAAALTTCAAAWLTRGNFARELAVTMGQCPSEPGPAPLVAVLHELATAWTIAGAACTLAASLKEK